MSGQTLQPGSTLQSGKYKIEKMLGQGGFGITYLAKSEILDGKVAIKEFFIKEYCNRDESTSHVSIPTEGNRELVERFKQKFIKEARTIFKLRHANIVHILDVFEENGTAYYVMDYIEGESLGDMVKRRGALPLDEASGYIRSVANALHYMHSKNLNHLDIKPSNLMKSKEDGQIIVIDFGTTKQYDAQTAEGTTTTPVGISHGYSPLEQYKPEGVQTFSPQSDVYALAATYYKLLTGSTPPEAITVDEKGLPVDELYNRGVPTHIVVAIQAAMKKRNERTQSVKDFVSALALTNKSVQTTDDTVIKRNETVEAALYKAVYSAELEKLADNGDANAQFVLGTVYKDGLGVNKNLTDAIFWFRNSAEKDNINALYELGLCYMESKKPEEAINWLKKAANNGHVEAQYKLAQCYRKGGDGIKTNHAEAVKLLQQAIDGGKIEALYELAECYESGAGVKRDVEQAKFLYQKWFKHILKKAEQGDTEAQLKVAECYYTGKEIEKDFKKAFQLYKKVAETGHTEAQLKVAECYLNGWGVEKNEGKAFELYTSAAKRGIAEAQFRLGRCYENGWGTQKNKKQAKALYKKAAEQGHSKAEFEIERINSAKILSAFLIILSLFLMFCMIMILNKG